MTAWLVQSLIEVSLALLIVLGARHAVARFAGAGWAYALWFLPVAVMALPTIAVLPIPAVQSPMLIPLPAGPAAPLPDSSGPGQWVPVLLALWAGGAAAFLLWQFHSYRAFLARIELGAAQARPAEFGGLPVLYSNAAEGPIAVGLVKRRIVLPLDFEQRYTPGERQLALTHELIHHRRGDVWWNVLGLVLVAANWFNPLAYLAFRAFRVDQELACDAAVAALSKASEREHYARALIKSASHPGVIAACPLHHADQLKRRLKMLKTHRTSTGRTIGGSLALVSVFAAGLGVSAAVAAQETDRLETREFHIKKDGKPGDEPFVAGMKAKCADGERVESRVSTEGDKKHEMFVVLCEAKGTPPAELNKKMIAHLEKAKAELGSRGRVPPEQRDEFARKLEQEIARLQQQANK